MKIVNQSKDYRRVRIDARRYLDARVTRQHQADDDKKADETGYTVKKFLHTVAAGRSGAGLFHSTIAG